jgi:hypothetical protein
MYSVTGGCLFHGFILIYTQDVITVGLKHVRGYGLPIIKPIQLKRCIHITVL